MKTNMTANTNTNTTAIARRNDGTVITDRDGDIAILRRHYDADGVPVVRYAPDPVDFHPAEAWNSATADQADRWVC